MIILASRSQSRQDMLRAAGVEFAVRPADVDERALEAALGDAPPERLRWHWPRPRRWRFLRQMRRGGLVLGSDSLVVVAGRRFDKPVSRADAAAHLRFFSGNIMHLHSPLHWCATALCAGVTPPVRALQLRPLSESFIADYLAAEWPAVGQCVGVFRIEGPGVHLFESIEGDHFTVLGMPLLAVLAGLRELGELPA